MHAKKQPKREAAFDICAPAYRNMNFTTLGNVLLEGLQAERKLAKKHGSCESVLMAFSEICLTYRYNIRKGDVLRNIEAFRKMLPDGVVVVFPVMEFDEMRGMPSNTCYIVSRREVQSYRKRQIGRYDIQVLTAQFDAIRYNESVDHWEKVAAKNSHVPFPQVQMGGKTVEIVNGVDILEPVKQELGRIMVVPSYGAKKDDISHIAIMRGLLAMNDARRDYWLRSFDSKGDLAGCGDGTIQWERFEVQGNFQFLRVYK